MQEVEKEFSYDGLRKVYQDKVESLELTIEDISKQLQDLQDANSDLERELEHRETFLNKAKEIIKKLNSECETNTKELHNARLEVDKYKSESHSFEKQLLEIQRSLNEFENLVKSNDNLRKQVRDLKQKLQSKEVIYDEKIAQQNELIDNLYQEKEELNKAIEELELKLGEIEKENENRESLFQSEISKADELRSQLKLKDQEISSLKEYLTSQEEAFNTEMQQIKRATENTLRNYHSIHSFSTELFTPRTTDKDSFSSPAKTRLISNRTPMKKSSTKLTPMKTPAPISEEKESETTLTENNLKDLLVSATMREAKVHKGIIDIVNTEGNFIKHRLDSLNKAHAQMKSEMERWIMRNEEMESRLVQSAETNKSFSELNAEYRRMIQLKSKQLNESKVIIDELMKYLSHKDLMYRDEMGYLDDLILHQIYPKSHNLVEDTTQAIYKIQDSYKDKTVNFERYIESINKDKIYWQDICKQYQEEILGLREELDNLRNEYTATSDQVTSLKQELEDVDRVLQKRAYNHARELSIANKVEDMHEEFETQHRQMDELKHQYNNVLNQLEQFRVQHTHEVEKLETEVRLVHNENDKLYNELQEALKKNLHAEDHQNRVLELEKKLSSLIDGHSIKELELQKLSRNHSKEITDLRRELDEKNLIIETMENEIARLRRNLEEANNKYGKEVLNYERILSERVDLNQSLMDRLAEKEDEAHDYEQDIQRLIEENRAMKSEQFETSVLRDQLAAQSQLIDSLHSKIARLTEEIECREVIKFAEDENARLNSELDEAVYQLAESRRRRPVQDDKYVESIFALMNVFKKILEGFNEQKISAENYLRSLKGRLSPEYEDILKRLYSSILTYSDETTFIQERERNFYTEILTILSNSIPTTEKQKQAKDLLSLLRSPTSSDILYISSQIIRLISYFIKYDIKPKPPQEGDRVLHYNLGRLERANLLMRERHNSLTQVLKKTEDMMNSLIEIGDSLVKPSVLHKIVDMYYKFFTYFIKDYENDQKRYINIYEGLKSGFDGNIDTQGTGRFHEEDLARLKQGSTVQMLDLTNLLRPIS